MTASHRIGSVTAEQTGAAAQYVADLGDVTSPDPGLRSVVDPVAAAALIRNELLSRLEALLGAYSGDPVVFLSGGVDSILVAAALAHLGIRPQAITMVTAEGTDRANAQAAASALGLPHEIVELDQAALVVLAGEAIARLGIPELWSVSYAIPLLAARPVLDRLGEVGAILTGSGADVILGGGKTPRHPIDSPPARHDVDQMIRKQVASSFSYYRLVPDFYPLVLDGYADRFVRVFQTVRFWEVAATFAPQALFRTNDDQVIDKLCLRIACEQLLPESVKSLAWTKKSPFQRSAGIMDALATAARRFAATLPGAHTHRDPMAEPYEDVASRLFLALLADTATAGK
ncbi:asparagine synthase-related protein [Nocardia altamirensis]|uniref:asparagine synthase-related protein n=1 Tax=Nocardia altamirensis TaxID=472158 RepID=UPI000840229D|nr:asparagine synthase-related protein [Nocardia altamirensis]